MMVKAGLELKSLATISETRATEIKTTRDNSPIRFIINSYFDEVKTDKATFFREKIGF